MRPGPRLGGRDGRRPPGGFRHFHGAAGVLEPRRAAAPDEPETRPRVTAHTRSSTRGAPAMTGSYRPDHDVEGDLEVGRTIARRRARPRVDHRAVVEDARVERLDPPRFPAMQAISTRTRTRTASRTHSRWKCVRARSAGTSSHDDDPDAITNVATKGEAVEAAMVLARQEGGSEAWSCASDHELSDTRAASGSTSATRAARRSDAIIAITALRRPQHLRLDYRSAAHEL